jgi:haloalkane dehalogenase
MALLSTPADRFSDVPNYDYDPDFVSVGEPDMAFVDVEGDGEETFLCLHGEPTWGFLYRKMIPRLRDRGRVVVPDFVGFGRSDKYDAVDEYTYDRHAEWLARFVEELDLTGVTLVCQDWGSILGLPLAVSDQPARFDRIVAMNALLTDGETDLPAVWHQFKDMVVEADDLDVARVIDTGCANDLTEAAADAYRAPFHSEASKAGAAAWPPMVPREPGDNGIEAHRQLAADLADYGKPFFALFSDADPITEAFRDRFRDLVPTATDQPDVWVEGGGHFLQEDAGGACADHIVDFVDRT